MIDFSKKKSPKCLVGYPSPFSFSCRGDVSLIPLTHILRLESHKNNFSPNFTLTFLFPIKKGLYGTSRVLNDNTFFQIFETLLRLQNKGIQQLLLK